MSKLIGALLGGLAEVLAFLLFGLEYLVVYLPKRGMRKWRNWRGER